MFSKQQKIGQQLGMLIFLFTEKEFLRPVISLDKITYTWKVSPKTSPLKIWDRVHMKNPLANVEILSATQFFLRCSLTELWGFVVSFGIRHGYISELLLRDIFWRKLRLSMVLNYFNPVIPSINLSRFAASGNRGSNWFLLLWLASDASKWPKRRLQVANYSKLPV